MDSDSRSSGDNGRSGVEAGSSRTRKCVVDITLKVISNEDSIELSMPLRIIGWG